jgi:hypothetical protein
VNGLFGSRLPKVVRKIQSHASYRIDPARRLSPHMNRLTIAAKIAAKHDQFSVFVDRIVKGCAKKTK